MKFTLLVAVLFSLGFGSQGSAMEFWTGEAVYSDTGEPASGGYDFSTEPKERLPEEGSSSDVNADGADGGEGGGPTFPVAGANPEPAKAETCIPWEDYLKTRTELHALIHKLGAHESALFVVKAISLAVTIGHVKHFFAHPSRATAGETAGSTAAKKIAEKIVNDEIELTRKDLLAIQQEILALERTGKVCKQPVTAESQAAASQAGHKIGREFIGYPAHIIQGCEAESAANLTGPGKEKPALPEQQPCIRYCNEKHLAKELVKTCIEACSHVACAIKNYGAGSCSCEFNSCDVTTVNRTSKQTNTIVWTYRDPFRFDVTHAVSAAECHMTLMDPRLYGRYGNPLCRKKHRPDEDAKPTDDNFGDAVVSSDKPMKCTFKGSRGDWVGER